MNKYLLIAATVFLAASVTGCESQKTKVEPAASATVQEAAPVAATAVPTTTPVPTDTPAAQTDLVEMQVNTADNTVKNVIGQRTENAQSLVIVNQTGGEISEFFIRRHPEDDDDEEWGNDLIQTAFTLPSGDRMLYYYQRQGQTGGSTLYDLRVAYTDPYRSECFFRSIPIETIQQIVLRMDGQDEDAIPYATYMTENNHKEYSTLNDVKRRLGMLDSDNEDEEEDYYNNPTSTPTPVPEDNYYEDPIDIGEISGDSNAQTDAMSTAASYIGQSLSSLESAVGSPNGSDYEDEPETGRTGYHYYGSFTVSTSVDDNGNEIVTGIW